MNLHFLKTEWSDIIILQQNDAVALVDTGFAEQYPMIRDYLTGLGVTKISFILLTHFHRDHYGSIPAILEDFEVLKVYLKEYSGLDCTTAWGSVADDVYRADEMRKYNELKDLIKVKSTLIQAEGLKDILFEDICLKLYNTDNTIRQIYEDSSMPNFYHKITCSENQNSLAVFIQVDGKNIFLGGDILDHPSDHPLSNYVNLQIARQIGQEIDIYKAPHHATYNTGLPETLAIYKPKTVVITNGYEYLSTGSDALTNLKNANPDVKILLTEHEHVVLST